MFHSDPHTWRVIPFTPHTGVPDQAASIVDGHGQFVASCPIAGDAYEIVEAARSHEAPVPVVEVQHDADVCLVVELAMHCGERTDAEQAALERLCARLDNPLVDWTFLARSTRREKASV